MFILSNCWKAVPYKIGAKNGLVTIEAEHDSVLYKATEANHKVQYFCFSRQQGDEEGVISRDRLVKAKMFSVETIFEKARLPVRETTYDMLIDDFGTKRNNAKRTNVGEAVRARAVSFNVDNQLLPNFNREAESPEEIYRIELMFSQELFEEFENAVLEEDELSDFLKGHNLLESGRVVCVVADCLYKFLSLKNISRKTIPGCYRFFYNEIKFSVVGGKLPSLERDKLTVKLYITILMLYGYTADLNAFPRFDLPKTKVVAILKSIGCTVSASGLVVLKTQPVELFLMK